jgi:hypothetical protein
MEGDSTLHQRQLWYDLTMGATLPGGAWEIWRAEPHRRRPDRALLHQPRYSWELGVLGSLQQVVVAIEEAIGTSADTRSDDGRWQRWNRGGYRVTAAAAVATVAATAAQRRKDRSGAAS